MTSCATLPDCAPPPSSVAPRSHAVGDCIADRYLLVELLGEGGMGSVFRARCMRLDVDVAIKLVRSSYAFPGAAARLQMEAQATAKVRHAAAVRVFDFGTTDRGDPYLVMELLVGASLAELLRKRGPLPELSAVRLLLPVAGALATAHERGVIHRDIKPANIVLVPRDDDEGCQPKVVDFGIAKLVDEAPADASGEEGVALGSIGYMAPEQLRGEPDVDATMDVWAFAVVLYELITGRIPFMETKPVPYLSAIMNEDPQPTTEVCAGDPELWSILRRGLSRARADRWPSMVDFAAALSRWALSRGAVEDVSGAPLERWTHRRPTVRHAARRPAAWMLSDCVPPSCV